MLNSAAKLIGTGMMSSLCVQILQILAIKWLRDKWRLD